MRIWLAFLVVASLLSGARPLRAQSPKTVTVALALEPDRLYSPTTLAGQLAANLVFDKLVGLDDQLNPYPVLAAANPSPDNSLVKRSRDGAPRHSRHVSAIETSDFARNPVGTGPYVLSSWEPGSGLTFTSRRAPMSQRAAQPALDTVVLRIMPDKNDSLTALAQGQVQVVAQDSLDAADAPVLDALPGIQARYTPGNAWEQLTLNMDNPILGDSSVRQAIAYGLNRDALNEAVMFGKAQVATGQLASWSWAFEPSLPHYDSNPAQANQLLDRAGWARSGADGIRTKNGQRLSLKYWGTPASFRPALMAMVKDQLAQVGIELNVDAFPSSVLFDASGESPQAVASHQFDVVQFAWVSSYDPGTDAAYTLASSGVPTRANGFVGGNYSDYKNPRNDQLLKQLQISLDPAFRRAALVEAQTIWQSDLPG